MVYSARAFIGRAMEYKSWKDMLQLYKTLGVLRAFWPSFPYKKGAEALERVQKRFAGILRGIESCKERSQNFNYFCWICRDKGVI